MTPTMVSTSRSLQPERDFASAAPAPQRRDQAGAGSSVNSQVSGLGLREELSVNACGERARSLHWRASLRNSVRNGMPTHAEMRRLPRNVGKEGGRRRVRAPGAWPSIYETSLVPL